MSKNISIKEVGVAQNINGVAHIKVPDMESGEIDFVPESDVTTVFKAITSNGTYLPASDSGDGYIAVLVDVPVKSLKGKDKTTGKTYTVSVDPTTGEIVKTEQASYPTSIHIVIPPTKRNYVDGDTIDYSGIHVYLRDQDGHPWISSEYPTGEIPFNELTFPVTTADKSSEVRTVTIEDPSVLDRPEIVPFSVEIIPPNGRKKFYLTYSTTNGYVFLVVAGASPVYITTFSGGDEKLGLNIASESDYSVFASWRENPHEGEDPTWEPSWKYQGNVPKSHYYVSSSFSENIPEGIVNNTISGDSSVYYGDFARVVFGANLPEGSEIPVQWSKDGGGILQDTFLIYISDEVSSSSGDSSSGGGHSSGDF